MAMVTANSCSTRPSMPPMNSTGMKTATREMVMETMVKPISREPRKAASIGRSPCSMWRTMFSSMTMASSTTKPTDRVRASRVILLTEKSSRYMPAKVPMMESGSARLGMMVAERLRKNRKITRMTRKTVTSRVNLTSETDSRMELERSYMTLSSTAPGSCWRKLGSWARMLLTTSMVLVPGWR